MEKDISLNAWIPGNVDICSTQPINLPVALFGTDYCQPVVMAQCSEWEMSELKL